MRPGARNLITDVPGILVGNAEDHDVKTGVTVLTSDMAFTASYAVLGGAPGTRETDLLEPDKLNPPVDALFLSGGSAFGLEAGSGIANALRAQGRGFAVEAVRVPIVPGAICFDLLNGGNKSWHDNPYGALGRAALGRAARSFDLGSVGAGTGAFAGDIKGGLGSASLCLGSGITVGALVAANPVGTLCDEMGRFWAAAFEIDGEAGGPFATPAGIGAPALRSGKLAAQGANTTIAIVATDACLSCGDAKRLAVAAHDGIARAIVPAHTPFDGDLVFAVSTARHDDAVKPETLSELGHAAAICLSRAIMRAGWHARSVSTDPFPTWQTAFGANSMRK